MEKKTKQRRGQDPLKKKEKKKKMRKRKKKTGESLLHAVAVST